MLSKLEVFLLGVIIVGWSSYVEAKNTEHMDMICSSAVARNGNFCQLCQEFSTRAIKFLKENETQTEIISTLHQVCSLLHSSKQCILLVDYYSSIFSAEIAKVEPKKLYDKVKLCEKAEVFHLVKNDDPCTICHNVVDEILTKLDDPDAQLEIIQTLLKGCNRIENFSHQILQPSPISRFLDFFSRRAACSASALSAPSSTLSKAWPVSLLSAARHNLLLLPDLYNLPPRCLPRGSAQAEFARCC